MNVTNILVPMDFGEVSRAAFRVAVDYAGRFQAALHVVHVVDDVAAREARSNHQAPDSEARQADLERRARQALATLVDGVADLAGVRTSVVVSARPAEALLDYARAAGIDLIVVGTHGTTSGADLILGSVAQQIVRSATCAVLTLRRTPSMLGDVRESAS